MRLRLEHLGCSIESGRHWRRLVKILGQPKYCGEKKVAILTDEIMVVSQLLMGQVPGMRPQSLRQCRSYLFTFLLQ